MPDHETAELCNNVLECASTELITKEQGKIVRGCARLRDEAEGMDDEREMDYQCVLVRQSYLER